MRGRNHVAEIHIVCLKLAEDNDHIKTGKRFQNLQILKKVMFIEFPGTGCVTLNFLLLISVLKLSALKYFFHLNFDFVVLLDCCLGWIHHLHQPLPTSISPRCAKLGNLIHLNSGLLFTLLCRYILT